jgi:hypothetical protein
MTKLDLVLARLRNLSTERQEAIAQEIAFRLEHETAQSVFTDAEWAQIEATMDTDAGEGVPHEQLVADMRLRFPG